MTQGNVREYLLELQTIISIIETSLRNIDKCKELAKNIHKKHSDVIVVIKDGKEKRIRRCHKFNINEQDLINASVERICLRLEEIADVFQFECDVFYDLYRR